MRWSPEQRRDMNAATLIAVGSLGLALTGYASSSLQGDESFALALISSAAFIGGGILYEKGSWQVMNERLSTDQVDESASLQIDYEI